MLRCSAHKPQVAAQKITPSWLVFEAALTANTGCGPHSLAAAHALTCWGTATHGSLVLRAAAGQRLCEPVPYHQGAGARGAWQCQACV